MSLSKYIIKRIVIAIPIFLAVIIMTWFIARAFPGNPFLFNVNKPSNYQMEIYYEAVELHGLNEPILIQFLMFMKNLFSGDWGTSWYIAQQVDVKLLVKKSFPISLELFLISGFFSYFLGKHIGISSATGKNKIFSKSLGILTSAGSAIPIFVLGLILINIFSVQSGIKITGIKTFDFPDPPWITGMRLTDCLISGEFELLWDSAKHYILPITLLCFQFSTLIARQVRSTMMDTMNQDYIRTARAKGCNEKTVIYKHAFKNGRIPILSVALSNFPNMFINLMLVEYVFEFPGFTYLLLFSIIFIDYNVLVISISIVEMCVVSLNLVGDISYAILDPRIRYD